jgi:ABC-type bacteriocin/lantibiotic exporter with double-glycine peptidase domain
MIRRFFIREAIQTSAMDCGPAALKSLLDGYGIGCSYGRLREACQTEIDGTSIDQLEATAVQLGLDAAQVMLPVDHLLDPMANILPAIVVVRNPDGATHFVVVWRRHGRWLQVMDSAVGRRWVPASRFIDDVYVHTMSVAATTWREWIGSEGFLAPLRRRIACTGAKPDALIAAACADAGPQCLSRLDAATRMIAALIARNAIKRGDEAARVLETLASSDVPIADEYWSGMPEGETVRVKGAVLIQVTGRAAPRAPENLSPELAAALAEKPARPLVDFFRQSFAGDAFAPGMILIALICSAAAIAGEAVLLRAFFDLGRKLSNVGERAASLGALAAFSAALLALEFSLWKNVLRLGRRLECRLRVFFQTKLPRLEDRYFRSRPISDLADRSHNVHQLRQAPELAAQFLRSVFELAWTTSAIAWLFPQAGLYAVAIALIAIGVPIGAQPTLAERDLRLRTHSGTLARFYLDALLGLTAIRCHGAARAVRHEQAKLLGKWAGTGLALQRAVTAVEGVQFGGSVLLAGWLVWHVVGATADPGGLLLLVYWTLNLPILGQEAASVLWQYPMLRNTALRLMEPLAAAESADATIAKDVAPTFTTAPALRWEGVTVRAGGHVILDRIDLDLQPASHVAIVGVSGAGKSSLVGLLLGWHQPSEGRVRVDGQPLDADALARLRRATAWIDPQVQIWNRSLYENLLYGGANDIAFDGILRAAELHGVVQTLPAGLQTALGEGGGLVSGGEGQRVRFGRGLARANRAAGRARRTRARPRPSGPARNDPAGARAMARCHRALHHARHFRDEGLRSRAGDGRRATGRERPTLRARGDGIDVSEDVGR